MLYQDELELEETPPLETIGCTLTRSSHDVATHVVPDRIIFMVVLLDHLGRRMVIHLAILCLFAGRKTPRFRLLLLLRTI